MQKTICALCILVTAVVDGKEAIEVSPVESLDLQDLRPAFSFLGVEYEAFDMEYAEATCVVLQVKVARPGQTIEEHGDGCLCSGPGKTRLTVLVKTNENDVSFRFAHRLDERSGGSVSFKPIVLDVVGGTAGGPANPANLTSNESTLLWNRRYSHLGGHSKTGESSISVFGKLRENSKGVFSSGVCP